MSRPGLPEPLFDSQNAPYFDGARRGELLLPKCTTCAQLSAPPVSNCTNCFGTEMEWVPASGNGTVFSYIEYHRAWIPQFAPYLPYNVSIIELDEGPRLISNVVPGETPVQVGQRVRAVFEDRGSWKVPVFEVAESGRAPTTGRL
jgi:uncharacterized OB-fold protein